MSDFSKTPDEGVEIGFGLGGHHIEFKPCGSYGASTLSGYEDPESFERRVAAGDYAKYRLEGCRVIDKRAAVERNYTLAIAMPMLGAGLAPRAVDSFMKRSEDSWFLKAFAGLEETGDYGKLARIALENKEFKGLDYVGIDIYTELWRAAGARIGVFHGGKITWEN